MLEAGVVGVDLGEEAEAQQVCVIHHSFIL